VWLSGSDSGSLRVPLQSDHVDPSAAHTRNGRSGGVRRHAIGARVSPPFVEEQRWRRRRSYRRKAALPPWAAVRRPQQAPPPLAPETAPFRAKRQYRSRSEPTAAPGWIAWAGGCRCSSHRLSTRARLRFTSSVGGSGPAVLLLHGFPATLAMWREIASVLAQRCSVACADLRGYGASGCPPSAADHAGWQVSRSRIGCPGASVRASPAGCPCPARAESASRGRQGTRPAR
jgi:alpha/beta hydrolase fold